MTGKDCWIKNWPQFDHFGIGRYFEEPDKKLLKMPGNQPIIAHFE